MNNKFNSAIAKTLASSVLLSSCSPDAALLRTMNEPKSTQDNDLANSKGVSISLALNDETRSKLKNIEPLVEEILQDSISAKEFAEDPQTFCTNRGYELMFNDNDSIVQMLKALGNEEIRRSLENNDFQSYFKQCNKIGIFNSQQTVNLNSIFKSEKEQEIFEAISQELGFTPNTRSVGTAVAVSVVVVVAIVIVITIGIDSQRSPKEQKDNKKDSIKNGKLAYFNLNNPECMMINLWALQHDVDTYQVVSEYKKSFINQIIDQLKVQNSKILTKYSENQISDFLKMNLSV